MTETTILGLLFLLVAGLYGSVGHAGASGYLAVMALVGVAPERMKPTALALNIVVATITTLNFRKAGVFYPRAVLPFAVGSVPLAFLGGAIHPTATWYRPLVAVVLVIAAARLLSRRAASNVAPACDPRPPWLASVAIGAVIGLLSGLTGTGGGIFLSPVVVFLGWASLRQSAGLSALFILVNSVAGLAGNATSALTIDVGTLPLVVAAGAGGFAGSWLGANRLPERPLSIALGLVLVVAAGKLALT